MPDEEDEMSSLQSLECELRALKDSILVHLPH
jgi:hypothetical protein